MQSLAHLSDDELVAQLQACCVDMRRCKTRVLVMLGDVEERRIYLLAAASSMWDYARRFLLMSHGTAYRFIAGARLCKRYPWLVDRIERGELHLTTLAHIASFITDHNVHDLIEETAGKKRADVDLVLRKWFGVDRRQAGNPMPYDAELLRMIERARELASHIIPSGDRLELAKAAYTVFIVFLERKTRAKTDAPRPAPTKPTKSISQHATRTMFERDGDQCTYVDERTGARCPSRAFIQREHEHMRVHGGSNDPENLRPMCSLCRVRHNARLTIFCSPSKRSVANTCSVASTAASESESTSSARNGLEVPFPTNKRVLPQMSPGGRWDELRARA